MRKSNLVPLIDELLYDNRGFKLFTRYNISGPNVNNHTLTLKVVKKKYLFTMNSTSCNHSMMK